jgi:uncharacterized membrane protein YccC
MIFFRRLTLILSFAVFLPIHAFAYAPVVDDSENFALLEEQQAAIEQPAASDSRALAYDDEQPALARDTLETETGSNNVGLVNKIQGLQQEIQELRGQLDVQAHELKVLQEQQLAFYKDLDARLRTPSSNVAKNSPSTDMSLDTKPAPAPTSVANASLRLC